MRHLLQTVVFVSALLLCGCKAPLVDHPQNDKIQLEVAQIINTTRTASGQALLSSLERLIAYDVFAVEQVRELADDPNPRLRSNAMWVLGQIRDPENERVEKAIVATLEEGLRDPDRLVRYEAASALLARNHWDVIPVLLEGLDEDQPGICMNCVEVLRRITSQNFGYTVDSPLEQREVAVQRWKDWYTTWSASRG